MKNLIILPFLLVSFLGTTQSKELKEIDALLNSKVSSSNPGLFVGIVKDGEIIYENYKGLASLQHKVKIDANTRSNIASTAKQFTALMVLNLALEQKLSLEDDIREYLPKLYPNVQDTIKIRHLINHTSGIRDFYDLMSIQQDPWWRKEGLDNDDAIELLEKQLDLAFKPGSRYLYSNSGYTLLTKIIEVASGEDFHKYSKNFFTNLEMPNTEFLKNYMQVIPNQALPYSDWGDGVWQQYPMITNLYGDGFLFTSLKDQLVFEQAIQNAKTNNNVLLIQSQEPIPNSEVTTYGFGLELSDRMNYKSVHHSGGTGSYHSQVIRFTEENLSIFVMSNNSKLWSGGIANEIAQVLLPKKEIEASYDPRLNEVEKESLNSVSGQYLSPNEYLIRIELKDGKLSWRNANNNPLELVQEKSNVYRLSYNPKLKVGFYTDKLILFYPSGKANVFSKIPYEKATLADLESFVGDYYSEELDFDFKLTLEDGKLKVALSGWDKSKEVEILNKNELLVFDYILKVQRDQFNRVVGMLLTTNRVLNNRFVKKTNLKFQPKIETPDGSINVSTISSKDGKASDILLTKNYPNGNEIWYKQFGGNSYDKANSILATEDGYIIIGSTSSYGNGNYDMLVIKTDKKGHKTWQKTYGSFYNEYGYSAEITQSGYLLKGSVQQCENNTDINRKCATNVWFVEIDKEGNEVSNETLEVID
ncbi:serine hydrolase domain-containing protein [Flagellimonas sp.]|uniref:serine hydrolase domain-containing protein n=1 Tax=Flagellimonas sp. TaxID=2058762 RepID=UPI003F49DBDB